MPSTRTSSDGKVAGAVAVACRATGVPCVVFGGVVRDGAEALYALGATAVLPLGGRRESAEADLESLGEALSRLLVRLGR